jgi:hypothetical protein
MLFLTIIYGTLFVIIAGLIAVYIGSLMVPTKPMGPETYIRRVSAVLLLTIIIGSITSWLQDCELSLGFPTFGLENRVTVIG